KGLDGDDESSQRRVIAATIEGVRVICVYAPNGQELGSPAWSMKLAWFDRLRDELVKHASPDGDLVLCGDLNVAPAPIDLHDPSGWVESVLFHADGREKLEQLCDWGLADALRLVRKDGGLYTWWDYRRGMYRRNKGLRIDLALVTKSIAARVKDVTIDKRPRE